MARETKMLRHGRKRRGRRAEESCLDNPQCLAEFMARVEYKLERRRERIALRSRSETHV